MKSILSSIAILAILAGCSATAADYSVVQKGEYQIAGHPYKTAVGCERTKPVGKFDGKCDIPVVGFRGFSDPTIGVQSGGPAGFSF